MISRYMRAKSLVRMQTPGAAPAGVTPAGVMPVLEALEQRLLLSGDALMDLTEYMVYPQIHYGYTGQVAYDAGAQAFESDATPFLWIGPGGLNWSLVEPCGILAEIAVSPGGAWDQEKYYIPLDDTHYMCRKLSETQFQALGTTATGQLETPPVSYVPDNNPDVYYYIFEADPGFVPNSDRDFNDFMVKVELYNGAATLTPWHLPGSPYEMFLVAPGTRQDLFDPSNPTPVPQWDGTTQPSEVTAEVTATNTKSFDLNVQVDDSGNLVGGATGDDLTLFGRTDTAEYGTLAGVLLTGEILDFAYSDNGATYEEFGFLFEPTGGELLPYFGTMDGGLYMISFGSNFTGDFTADFTGYSCGYLGPIERPEIGMDTFVRVETVTGDGTVIYTDHGPRKPVTLTFDYTGGGEDATDTAQRWNQYSVAGDPNDAPVVDIIASSKAKFRDVLPENTYFSGQLNFGEEFVVAVDNATTAYSSTSTSQNTPDLFKPDTYIYILDHLTGEILQSVKYHTSGSEPIVIGDVLGGVTLTGFSFPETKHPDPPEPPLGDDADEGPGIDVALGDTITWTYVVSNPGDVPLNNVTVTDDNTTPDDPSDDFNPAPITENGFNIGDTNMDGWLDMDETWLFRFSDLAVTQGEFTSIGRTAGYYAARNKWVYFEDPANYRVTLPPIDVGATGERPQVLVMRYTGDGPEATSHAQGAAHVSVTGDPSDKPTVRIIATDRQDFSYSNTDIYFDGEVALGELFAIDATEAGVSRLAPNLYVYIFDPATNDLLQSVKFHTSCSEAIVLGDQFGALQLNGYLGWRGTRLGLVPVELLTSLSGFAFEDFNNDGMVDFNEYAIENVLVTLTGTNDRGEAVNRTDTTDEDGAYLFDNLRPGEYTITQAQPIGYVDGMESRGTAGGVAGNDVFTNINLRAHVDGTNYNFGERPLAGSTIQTGQTATIGFWAGRKGQQLLKSLNGDQNSKQLGDWLAATFPNMYQNLAGKANANVARTFTHLFKKAGMNDKSNEVLELEAQVMATALAAYVTNANLAGYIAVGYGFEVTEYGLGIATWNVGTSGAAFGVDDYTEMTVMDLLLAANERTLDGRLYYQNQESDVLLLRTLANEVFEAINEQGTV